MTHRTLAVVAAMAVVLVTVAPVAAVTVHDGTDRTGQARAANETQVNVTVGQQLSTIVVATDSDVRSAIGETAFEFRLRSDAEGERAEAIAERADELTEQAAEIREDYREATRAYERGELSKSEYAERIAMLNARADDLVASIERLRARAQNLSSLELRVAGVTPSQLRTMGEGLDNVTGVGATALLRRFTGRSTGEVEIETRDGLTIEVESEDGETSREIERPRDDDRNITIPQTAAFETAREELGSAPVGNWSLRRASVHEEDGYYRFRFELTGSNASGKAEVRVDGSTGTVFRLETEIEPPEDDEDDEDDRGRADGDRDGEGSELVLLIANGTPRPGERVTVQARTTSGPVGGVTVTLNGDPIGVTDENGTITVRLPAEEAKFRAERGDAEAELEFEFETDDDAGLRDRFQATGSVDNGSVTVQVTYDGSGVSGAEVVMDDRVVGTTDASGSVTFDAPDDDEIELEVHKGAFVAELEFAVRQGSMTLVSTEFDHDRDDEEDEDDEEETDTPENEDDEDDEETDTPEEDDEDDEETDTPENEDDDSSG